VFQAKEGGGPRGKLGKTKQFRLGRTEFSRGLLMGGLPKGRRGVRHLFGTCRGLIMRADGREWCGVLDFAGGRSWRLSAKDKLERTDKTKRTVERQIGA